MRPPLLATLGCLHLLGCGPGAAGLDLCSAPPQAPTLGTVHAGARLRFAPEGAKLEVGWSPDAQAAAPTAWWPGRELVLPDQDLPRPVRAFARALGLDCAAPPGFAFTYQVQAGYPPPAGEPGSTAVALDDPRVRGWARGVVSVSFGDGVEATWREPARALGPAEGLATGVVSLGEGGRITLELEPPLADGTGPELAVFENGLDDGFLELARVAVSSDGRTFARFDCATLADAPVGAYERMDTRDLGGLAGKYRAGFGTPFDLGELATRPEVLDGRLDLGAVRYVRIEDVPGDGRQRDSFGQPIYDPYPTTGSAGFDLDAVAALGEGS
ncbi:MAG TPA: hypothetical protein PK668_27830 [Myxococcota bacterium]|nr:hypothetical protein [Myxococcota bacterium]HRY97294.1 hypothetical protein [Myxococcota bacterium]HSA22946.1 hypothetical protein [Myxococcota bacterium]